MISIHRDKLKLVAGPVGNLEKGCQLGMDKSRRIARSVCVTRDPNFKMHFLLYQSEQQSPYVKARGGGGGGSGGPWRLGEFEKVHIFGTRRKFGNKNGGRVLSLWHSGTWLSLSLLHIPRYRFISLLLLYYIHFLTRNGNHETTQVLNFFTTHYQLLFYPFRL